MSYREQRVYPARNQCDQEVHADEEMDEYQHHEIESAKYAQAVFLHVPLSGTANPASRQSSGPAFLPSIWSVISNHRKVRQSGHPEQGDPNYHESQNSQGAPYVR